MKNFKNDKLIKKQLSKDDTINWNYLSKNKESQGVVFKATHGWPITLLLLLIQDKNSTQV